MKDNCFAFNNKRCRALDKMLCATNNTCPFYKTVEEERNNIVKVYEHISTLNKAEQKYISDTYYNGRCPWLKEDDTHGC